MTDLTQLRAERDVARQAVWGALGSGGYFYAGADQLLDPLLLAERRLAVAEACEAMETEATKHEDGYGRQVTRGCAAFLRARLTATPVSGSSIPEETGR